jgi:primosomal protein N' (replication factor Y)
VVELAEQPPREGLREVGAKVMAIPAFDQPLLGALTWAAQRYVAPVSVLLERAMPPNLSNRVPEPPAPPARASDPDHPLGDYIQALVAGRKRPPAAFLARSGSFDWMEALSPILAEGGSLMVVVATGIEVADLADEASRHFREQLIAVSPDSTAAATTEAWSRCQSPGSLLIGTPRVIGWPMAGLKLAIAVEEGRRAMKDRQTPTLSVRDLLRTRAKLGGHGMLFVGPTPSVETVAAGASTIRARPRAWPSVQVVDRNQEPETSGLVGITAIAAIRAVLDRDGRVFVFAHRRGYSPAARCMRCRTLRRCPNCGARPEPDPNCPRCGADLGPCTNCGFDRFVPLGAGVGRVTEELQKKIGTEAVAAPSSSRVQVGSEADLASLEPVDLAVAVDADGLILGTNYRAGEEALRILARLVGKVAGRSSRGLIQTTMPDHAVIHALRSGDPLPFLTEEIEQRRRLGFPPAGQLMVVELSGEVPAVADGQLRALGAAVMGPATRNGHHRWLLQGKDLGKARTELRPLVQRWRDAGVSVRIDVDPLDL